MKKKMATCSFASARSFALGYWALFVEMREKFSQFVALSVSSVSRYPKLSVERFYLILFYSTLFILIALFGPVAAVRCSLYRLSICNARCRLSSP